MKIELNQVSKRYGKRSIALNNTNLFLDGPSITGLVGRNGAGKTTLLQMLAGYVKPTSGKLLVNEQRPFNNVNHALDSILIDDQMTFPDSVNLDMIMNFGERSYPAWNRAIGDGLFRYFDLDSNASHEELSKGKRSLFNAVFGLASRASLTLFDEPTTGMDEETRRDFYRALLKDYLDQPRTIIVSSHHLKELEDILEETVVIESGEVLLHQSMADLEEYAFSVTGPVAQIDEAVHGVPVMHEEAVGLHMKTVVLKRDLSTIPEPFADQDLKIGRVSATDVCRYLTGKRKGGIDDVYLTTNHG